MKCSRCGGQVISVQYSVYRSDGSSSGNYRCTSCGVDRDWHKSGMAEEVIDMGIEE